VVLKAIRTRFEFTLAAQELRDYGEELSKADVQVYEFSISRHKEFHTSTFPPTTSQHAKMERWLTKLLEA